MASESKPVGIIGTGLMGMACAKRLTGAGYAVLGYDVDPAKASKLETLGARGTSALADIARDCDVAVIAVFNTDQVEQVLEGPQGLLALRAQDAPPMTVMCVSTCDPDRISALVQRLPSNRIRYVDLPVSGTSGQTADGDGLALIGGDRAAVDAVRPVIDAICPRGHYLGAAGNGGRAKLAINLILGVNRAALAEGLVFAQQLGLEPGAFLDVARDSAAYSQIMDVKGKRMVAGEYQPPHGLCTQTQKDFKLMLEQAGKRAQRLPLAENLPRPHLRLRRGPAKASGTTALSSRKSADAGPERPRMPIKKPGAAGLFFA